MYHGLVYQDNTAWMSFGLHIPVRWTPVFQMLQCAHGEDRVASVFWEDPGNLSDVFMIRLRMEHEVSLANQAQEKWHKGQLSEATNSDGALNVSLAIKLLSKGVA